VFKEGCDVGMVSDGHGLDDSPDCESISGGVSSKGRWATAIARQANMMQWGFYGAPDRMTESAKRAFLNAIVYMKQFDGQVPLVRKVAHGRTWLEQYIETLEQTPQAKLTANPQDQTVSYFASKFPSELIQGGIEPGRLRKWYQENQEYLTAGTGFAIVVDQDLASLRMSNRTPEFLDWLVNALRHDPQDATALMLARRYLGEEIAVDGAAAIAFVNSNRPFLFFTDTGGYRWMVNVNAKKQPVALR
jgi:hypothetical protein